MAARPRLCHCSAAAPVLKTATSQPVGSLAAVWRIAVLKLDLLICSAITCAFRRVRSSSTRICDVEVSCALQSSNQISTDVAKHGYVAAGLLDTSLLWAADTPGPAVPHCRRLLCFNHCSRPPLCVYVCVYVWLCRCWSAV